MSNIEYRYKIVGYGKTPIERVEMVSETAKTIIYLQQGYRGRYETKALKAGKFFPSFEAARQAWQDQLQVTADSYRQNLDRALGEVGNAKGLKDPYGESA